MIFSFRTGKERFFERSTSQVKRVFLLFLLFLKLAAERLIVRPHLCSGHLSSAQCITYQGDKSLLHQSGAGEDDSCGLTAALGSSFAEKEQEIDYSGGLSCLTLFNLTEVRLASFKTQPCLMVILDVCFLAETLFRKMQKINYIQVLRVETTTVFSQTNSTAVCFIHLVFWNRIFSLKVAISK